MNKTQFYFIEDQDYKNEVLENFKNYLYTKNHIVNSLFIGKDIKDKNESLLKLIECNLNECKKIGSSAFYNCTSITQLTLSKCEEIYPFAFANCHSLNKVYINTEYATCQLMGDYVFCTHSGSTCLKNENIVFYFKPETLEYYKSSPYWSHYADNGRGACIILNRNKLMNIAKKHNCWKKLVS